MKFKNYNLFLLSWMTVISNCLGQNTVTIDCTNNESITSIFNDPIDLTLRGIIKIYENVTINEILSTTNNEFEHNYIDARLESSNTSETKNLVLFTTEYFDTYAQEQTAARISLKINLSCGMGKERVVIFFQPFEEGNYFSPIFSKNVYELLVPTPIFAGFDLAAFSEITAKDDDLTRNQILFTSNDSLKYYVSVGTKNATSTDKKTYFANMTLEKILLELPQPIEFEIVATDNGDPPKSSKATVVIRTDPKRSLPPRPKFTKSLYKGLINVDFNMEPIQLNLSNSTYTSEIEFILNGVNVEGFHLQDNKNGSIEVRWNSKNLNRSDILKHKSWELDVKAEHRNLAEMGSANVIVEMVNFENYFKFMSSYYEGNIDEMGELHFNPIVFNPYIYQSDMKFTLQQSSHNFFNLSIQNYSIQLQLNNNFTWQINDEMGYLKLTLLALWENLSSVTNIVIKLPQIKNETTQQMLQFEKFLYVGRLSETFDLELETIVLKTDVTNIEEIKYTLSGSDSDKFFMMRNKTHLDIKTILNLISPQEIIYKSFYLLILEAEYSDVKTYASVLINVPQMAKEIRRKVFLVPFVKGNLIIHNNTQQISIESIYMANDLVDKFDALKFRLRGDYSLHFDIKVNYTSRLVDIVLKTPISSNIFTTKHLLNMTLQANLTGSDGFIDTLMVFIELPIKECPPATTSIRNPPQFSSKNYVFTIYTNQTGILGVVNAFNKGGDAKLRYILGVQTDMLAQRLSINPLTGELNLYGTIEEGNYLFNITAENIETHERAVVKALLKVQQRDECILFQGVAVEKTLMILHVDEEKPNYGVLDLKFNENCTFHIEDVWPSDKEYVHVNYIFNILDTIAIDREDDIFQNMSEPQIIVKLRLKCDKEDQLRNLTIDIIEPIETRSLQITFTEDMPYSPDIMWLYIKIDDINDNPPEFKISEGPIYLGYPAGNAAWDIYPEYLTQIEAFDRDEGYNAELLFQLRDNPYFNIEPKTGKIYPRGKTLSKNEQTELIVLAIDQNGEGLISNTVVLVKGLTSDFYNLITLKEYSAKTKQQIENELSQKTGYNINILKMSYVPQVSQWRSSLNESLSCKAWIYAYDKHQLVTYREMQEHILVKNPEANIVNMESYDEAALRVPLNDNTNFYYLIVTIVLSLTSCSSLIFIIWRFCYKNTPTTKTSTQIDSHNRNFQQQECAEYYHGSDSAKDSAEYNNCDKNRVKFSDLAENGSINRSQSK